MKKIFTIVAVFLSLNVFSQQSNKITWYGLDFTNAKMIGSLGFKDPYVICNNYIHYKWNAVVFTEQEKYNVSKYLGGVNTENNSDIVKERNSKVTPENLVIDNDYSLTSEKIADIIKEFPLRETEGTGLVFIVESFNKSKLTGNVWVTLFNEKTLEVIQTKKMTGKPSGFGISSYWANSIYSVMKQLPFTSFQNTIQNL